MRSAITKSGRVGIVALSVSLSLLLGPATVGLAEEHPAKPGHAETHGKSPHWGYEGEAGPAHWSELDPAFSACASGKYESPIDIEAAEPSDLPPLRFDYKASPLTIVDNGHTIMATYAPGSTLTVGDARYELLQLHLHHPSEGTVHGKTSAMEVHLVHKDAKGHLAVVAVLLDQSGPNPVIEKLLANLPTDKGKTATIASVSIDAGALLPASRGYYTFAGSLTTPPCTEGVTWYVLKSPMEVSQEQLAGFAKLYPMNARPVQPLHGRKILATRD
jgi:carbonic anhydrase